jgi:hypothetical protein
MFWMGLGWQTERLHVQMQQWREVEVAARVRRESMGHKVRRTRVGTQVEGLRVR